LKRPYRRCPSPAYALRLAFMRRCTSDKRLAFIRSDPLYEVILALRRQDPQLRRFNRKNGSENAPAAFVAVAPIQPNNSVTVSDVYNRTLAPLCPPQWRSVLNPFASLWLSLTNVSYEPATRFGFVASVNQRTGFCPRSIGIALGSGCPPSRRSNAS
jgi:hypothetical protein